MKRRIRYPLIAAIIFLWAMLMLCAATAQGAVEDFTAKEWTTLDSDRDTLTVTAAKVAWADEDRGEIDYVYRADLEFGGADFTHLLEVSASNGNNGAEAVNWALAKEVKNLKGIYDEALGADDFLCVRTYWVSNLPSLQLCVREGRTDPAVDRWDSDASVSLAKGATYYLTLAWTAATNTLVCTIYSDALRTVVVDEPLTITVEDTTTYTVLYAMSSWDSGHHTPIYEIDGFTQNLDIGAPVVQADTWYCNLAAVADGKGTEVSPFQWSQAIDTDLVDDLDTVNLKGTYAGATAEIGADCPLGTSSHWLLYQQWAGQDQATFNKMTVSAPDAYVKLSGITFDQTQTAGGGALSTSGDYVYYEDCTIQGWRNAVAGDWAPYLSVLVARSNALGNSIAATCTGDNVTYDGCTFLYGAYALLKITNTINTRVKGCTFGWCSDNGIMIDSGQYAYGLIIEDSQFADKVPESTGYYDYASYYPDQTTWETTHLGAAIIQDVTNCSGVFTGTNAANQAWVLPTDLDIPFDTDMWGASYKWRLVSDPTVYFYHTSDPDCWHSDCVQTYGTHDSASVIRRCYMYPTAHQHGQFLKLAGDGAGMRVENNIISALGGSHALYLESASNWVIQNNTVGRWIDLKHNAIYATTGSSSIQLINNVFDGYAEITAGAISVNVNNLYATAKDADLPTGSGNVYSVDFSSGYFTNYAAYDFNVPEGSSLIDAGSATSTVETDYDGNPRPAGAGYDIGAMEYQGPYAPTAAVLVSPLSGSTGRPISQTLTWSDGGGALTYNVYFGTDSTPDETEAKGNQAGTTYDPGTLTWGTTYYWRIDSVNATGTTAGTVWSFATDTVPIQYLITRRLP